jgi:Fic-DOC domain mobile mystery protein B
MIDPGHTEGATAGEDESGLLKTHLTGKSLRDAAELESIARAYDKNIFRARRKKQGSGWLTEEFVRQTHVDMFGDIWEWAGKYRTSAVNIGIDWHAIPEQIGALCGDFQFWDASEKMAALEIAARLQNRLTRIHPFKNGNGRHARLITDVFFYSRHLPLPRWPQLQLMPQGDNVRRRYISSMKMADSEDFSELMQFMNELMAETA